MPSIKDPGLRSVDGPITFADVLAHIPAAEDGTIAPLTPGVNAAAIRAALGRGSNATVQKHLDAIRNELIVLMQPAPVATMPSVPTEVVAAIWAVAWSAAQASTLARLDRVTVERDVLVQRSAVQMADLDALAAEADRTREQAAIAVAVAVAERDVAHAALQARESDLSGQLAVEYSARTDAETVLLREREVASHEAEIAAKDWEIERRTMQAQIDRLQERLAEMRGLEIWAAGQAGPSVPK